MWDAKERIVMHSLAIPRAVCVLAGGIYHDNQNRDNMITIEVSASLDNKDWCIVQSPFMQQNALTKSFHQIFTINNGVLTYSETTMLDIYGKEFEHTDSNELVKQG